MKFKRQIYGNLRRVFETKFCNKVIVQEKKFILKIACFWFTKNFITICWIENGKRNGEQKYKFDANKNRASELEEQKSY